ncbi:IucA/IucC family protein [Emticicia sp. 21SJ11W-3]|uniref:IucA/IucC family protein n=1 Tax=Emticicia sp. 21SJ11W-3 TaxID=2916755 RepID=UPI0020A1B28C|nr:IucA/IucC family protein [Emticicia sp. 21SJ11W-3]UTA67547.1 hypothetical protein MB380_18390 [Emticicia sp. 21SJ11W-3]
MLLDELILHPYRSRYYLERYVNDGSPSGFSTINTTKPKTSPFELNSWFNLYICFAPKMMFREYGNIPEMNINEINSDENWIFVHPDMFDNIFFLNKSFKIKLIDQYKVVPTASGRTVQLVNTINEDYIKLHYSGILGRISRELPFFKAIAGPEISNILKKAVDEKLLNKSFSFLPELGARVLINPDNMEEWGMVWRENKPYGLNEEFSHFMLPSFSLFSMDRLNIHHFPILKQIIDKFNYEPEQYALEKIIYPLIECYFSVVINLGLQPELNSQNLLLGFNKDFSKCSFVIRDLESVDKDLTLMRLKDIKFNFLSYPYKCIESTQFNYSIKHSFMYDFKLGESILEPIINLINQYYNIDKLRLQLKIKEYSKQFIKQLPKDFYPRNKWYVFDKVLVDQTKIDRPYIECSTPKFR